MSLEHKGFDAELMSLGSRLGPGEHLGSRMGPGEHLSSRLGPGEHLGSSPATGGSLFSNILLPVFLLQGREGLGLQMSSPRLKLQR